MTVIYALKDPGTGEVRYIGKTNDLQARMRSHRWDKRNLNVQTHKAHWLRTFDGDPIVKVLEICTAENWSERERFWIKRFRRGGSRLTNIADGGQTSPVEGRGHTLETKAKMRASAIARGVKPPSRAGATAWNKGIKGVSRANSGSLEKGCTAWNKGKTMSDELVEKNRLGHIGKPWTQARHDAQKARQAI